MYIAFFTYDYVAVARFTVDGVRSSLTSSSCVVRDAWCVCEARITQPANRITNHMSIENQRSSVKNLR